MALTASITAPIFDPHRFKSTADHYVRGRLAYPSALIQQVAARVGIDRDSRVLDLGCGPGFLAVAFRRLAGEVIGIDPEAEMLVVAQRYAREARVDVDFRLGSSYDLKRELGLFRFTAMGRSFHWMDRSATLRALDQLTVPGGAIGLFRDHHLAVPENAWKARFDALFAELEEKDPARDIDRRVGHRYSPHEGVLLQSPFSRLERTSVIRRITTPVEHLIDRALSFSIATPERLGSGREAFLDRLHRFADQEAPDGTLTEIVETEALLAFRAGEG